MRPIRRGESLSEVVSNHTPTNGSHSLSHSKSVTHSSSLTRAHTAAHTRKQGVFQMVGAITTLGVRCVVRNLCARSGQKSILYHLCMDRGNVGEKQRAFGTAMRSCASLFRGVAAPLGCVICLQLGDVAVFSLCAQYFLNMRGGGGITTPGVLCVLSKRWTTACQSGSFVVF